ncbi:MAG: hypothetical protein MUC96_27405 [Myxococcaceae bacterium]|jgi:hypothetical protein|nr:hypothetical protein [Myxococcaceae bacterium]
MNVFRAVLWSLALVAAPASAQYSGFTNLSIPSMNSFIATQQLSAQVRMSQRALDRVTHAADSTPAGAAQPAPAPAKAPTATTFRQSGKRLLVQRFSASLSDDPGEVKQMNEAFTAGFKAFEAEAKRLGRPNSVAMAFAYLVGVCVMVDSDHEAPEAALLTLQAKVDAAFGESPEFRKLTDVEKQKLYETMVLMATLPLAGYMVAKEHHDDELLQQYRAIAATALEVTLGVRPDRLYFTENSLELKQ